MARRDSITKVRRQGWVIGVSLIAAFAVVAFAMWQREAVSAANCRAINETRSALVLILQDAASRPADPGEDPEAREEFFRQAIAKLQPLDC